MKFYMENGFVTLLILNPDGTFRVNNQLDALFECVYFTSLHVSSNPVLIIMRINRINTSSGMYHNEKVCQIGY